MKKTGLITLIITVCTFIVSVATAADSQGYATIISAKGSVLKKKSSDPDNKWQKTSVKTKLFSSDMLKTGKLSNVELKFNDGSIIIVDADTTVSVDTLLDDKKAGSTKGSFKLFIGRLWSNITKGKIKSSYDIRTSSSVISVRGTNFNVEANADNTSAVSVSEGKVGVIQVEQKDGKEVYHPEVEIPAGFKAMAKQTTAGLTPQILSTVEQNSFLKAWQKYPRVLKNVEKSFKDTARNITTSYQSVKEKAFKSAGVTSDTLSEKKEKLQEKAAEKSQTATEKAQEVKEKIMDKGGAVKEKASEGVSSGVQKTEDTLKKAKSGFEGLFALPTPTPTSTTATPTPQGK